MHMLLIRARLRKRDMILLMAKHLIKELEHSRNKDLRLVKISHTVLGMQKMPLWHLSLMMAYPVGVIVRIFYMLTFRNLGLVKGSMVAIQIWLMPSTTGPLDLENNLPKT